jgi:hypothetical protein
MESHPCTKPQGGGGIARFRFCSCRCNVSNHWSGSVAMEPLQPFSNHRLTSQRPSHHRGRGNRLGFVTNCLEFSGKEPAGQHQRHHEDRPEEPPANLTVPLIAPSESAAEAHWMPACGGMKVVVLAVKYQSPGATACCFASPRSTTRIPARRLYFVEATKKRAFDTRPDPVRGTLIELLSCRWPPPSPE